MYRKVVNDSNRETLQIYLDRLEEREIENTRKINPGKSKAVSSRKLG
jgi:hypothetical protein